MEGFKLVAEASLPPGKCIASRDIEGPFIDTGNQITERGRVYISTRWLREAAEEFLETVPRPEFEAVQEALREAEERIAELEEGIEARDKILRLEGKKVPA